MMASGSHGTRKAQRNSSAFASPDRRRKLGNGNMLPMLLGSWKGTMGIHTHTRGAAPVNDAATFYRMLRDDGRNTQVALALTREKFPNWSPIQKASEKLGERQVQQFEALCDDGPLLERFAPLGENSEVDYHSTERPPSYGVPGSVAYDLLAQHAAIPSPDDVPGFNQMFVALYAKRSLEWGLVERKDFFNNLFWVYLALGVSGLINVWFLVKAYLAV